jgi:O-antigen ligase
MYAGACANKNGLGSLVLVSGLFLFWDLFSEFGKEAGSRQHGGVLSRILLLAMMVWIVRLADCATALVCILTGMSIFFCLRMPFVKRNLRFMEVYLALGALVFVGLNSMLDLRGMLLHSLGRNETLTTRTDLWDFLPHHQSNMLFGAGFNTFWSGERLRDIWQTFPGILQAHNGYLETYLDGGVLGVGFLLAWLWSASRRIKKSVMEDADFASVRMMFLCIAVIYNWTEAAFNEISLVWLVLLLVAIEPPGSYRVPAEIPVSGIQEDEAAAELAGGAPRRSGFGA